VPALGYVTAGRLTVRYGYREEVIEAGDAFYMPPGHVPAAVAGTELVMFSPQAELAAVKPPCGSS
jgi:quercetin dioxygenase-like cupin family protein